MEQIEKILRDKKTDLLSFISAKKRPFKAHLILGKDGKLGWEFAARVKKPEAEKMRG